MAYPSVAQGTESKFVPINSNKLDIASNGTVRARVTYVNDVFNATVIHPYITETEKDSILTFYDSNKTGSGFDFVRIADGLTYTLIFNGRPEVYRHNSTWWSVISKMIGGVP